MTGDPSPPGTRLHRIGWETPDALTEPLIRRVVEHFYAQARRDPVIGPVFNRIIPNEAWPHHLDLITDFWSSMLLGTGRYGGRPMPKHMAIPELSDSHFMRWLSLFRQTVEQICPPDIAQLFIERSERIGNSFRMNIAMRRGQDITGMAPLQRESLPNTHP
jgi:hemoglobin